MEYDERVPARTLDCIDTVRIVLKAISNLRLRDIKIRNEEATVELLLQGIHIVIEQKISIAETWFLNAEIQTVRTEDLKVVLSGIFKIRHHGI
jgi:hypothetical protein